MFYNCPQSEETYISSVGAGDKSVDVDDGTSAEEVPVSVSNEETVNPETEAGK